MSSTIPKGQGVNITIQWNNLKTVSSTIIKVDFKLQLQKYKNKKYYEDKSDCKWG